MSAEAETEAARLSVALEAKLLQRLVDEWGTINYTYFKNALRKPVLRLSDTRQRLGQWQSQLRCLEISRPLVLERSWPEVVEVLKHEVAHQFVDEHLRVDEDPHGPTFRAICELLGIDARAQGELHPGVNGDADDDAGRTVARIRKLLALALSPNQHEAEAAAIAARRLMLKFNIDVDQTDPRTAPRRYGYRHLGKPTGRIFEHDRWLAKILTSYFFVDGVWLPVYRPIEGKRGSVFEICGLEANLLMAEHVHAFLTRTSERLWAEYKKDAKIRSNRDRQPFLAGVMRGFDGKLASQTTEFQEQGLVWVPAPELKTYFRRRHPRVVYASRSGARRNEAYVEGARAGRNIVLSKPVTSGPGAGGPKALKS